MNPYAQNYIYQTKGQSMHQTLWDIKDIVQASLFIATGYLITGYQRCM